MKEITIHMQDNPACYVQRHIAEKIGFNIRIQSSKEISKNKFLFRLEAIIPHRICLTNGNTYDGQIMIKNLDTIIVEDKKGSFVLKKDCDLEAIDKTLHEKIQAFNKDLKLAWIQHSGRHYELEPQTNVTSRSSGDESGGFSK